MKNLVEIEAEDQTISANRTNIITTGINMNCDRVIVKDVLFKSDNRW